MSWINGKNNFLFGGQKNFLIIQCLRTKYQRLSFSFMLGTVVVVLGFTSGCYQPLGVTRPEPATGIHPSTSSPEIPSSPEAQRQFQSAEEDFQARRMNEALAKFQAFAVRFPQDPLADDAFFRIGQIYMSRDDPYLASLALERIPADFPNSNKIAETYELLSEIYERLQRPEDAIFSLKRLLELSATRSEKGWIYRELAVLQHNLGRDVEALESLEKAWSLAESPSMREEIQQEGEAVIEALQDEQALHQIVRRFAGSFAGQFASLKLGELYISRHQDAQAREVLQEVSANPVVPSYGEEARRILDTLLESADVDRLALGCIVPLSGEYEQYGRKIVQGIELAALPYLTIGDTPDDIKLIYRDSEGDPETAREAVRSLVQEHKVIGIIGPMEGGASAAAAEEAQELKVPLITLTPQEDIPALGGYVFRNFLTADQQIRFLVSYTMETLGLQRFAILYPDDQYGKKYMNIFWDEVEARKGLITAAESYSRDRTDFSTEIKKLAGIFYTESRKPVLDFQALFIPDTDYKVGLIAPQLAHFDVVGIYLLGTSLWNTPMLAQMAGPFLQKALFVDGFFPQSTAPLVKSFVETYSAKYGDEPDVWAAHGFDTASILLELIVNHNVSSRAELLDKLRQVREYPGVTGSTSFTSGGEVNKTPFILTIQDNRIVEVGYVLPDETRKAMSSEASVFPLSRSYRSEAVYQSDKNFVLKH